MCFSVTTFSINLFVGNEFEWIFFHNVPRAVYDTHTHTHIYIRRIAFELQSKVLRRVTSHRGWASEISGICQLQRERREEWKTGGGSVGARGKSSGYSFELQMAGTILCALRPTGWSFSAKRRWNLPALPPPPCVCVYASLRVYAPSSLSLPLIRRSLPSPEAAEKFS